MTPRIVWSIRGCLALLVVFVASSVLADRDAALTAFRVANVGVAVITALAFYVRINDMWSRLGFGGRLIRGGVLLMLANAAYGSAEAYLGVELGLRSAALFVALLTILTGVVVVYLDREDPDR